MTNPAVWRILKSDFHQLALKYGDRLTATGDQWYVFRPNADDGDYERNLFVSLAKRAGVHLGRGGQANPLFAWLDHLRFKGTNSLGVHCEGDVGQFEVVKIERICQASVECCYDLETDSMNRQQALSSGDASASTIEGRTSTTPGLPPAPAAFIPCGGKSPLLNVKIIVDWMEEEGFTNETLAQKLKISERAVSSIRNNGDYHGFEAITKLANQMGRDPEDLYLPPEAST
jgi:hypothetical protein